MSKYIKVNGCKLPIDMADLSFLERLLKAQETSQAAMAATNAEFPGEDAQSQYKRVEACVNAVINFFDELFGAGTSERIFHRTNDAAVYVKALTGFAVGLVKADKMFCRRMGHGGTLKLDIKLTPPNNLGN